MRRRDVILLLGAAVIARPPAASAQRSDRVSRIGVLHVLPQQSSLGFIAFRERLGELGYVEGRNIAVEYRWSDQPERLPALAAELTASNVHVIVAADEKWLYQISVEIEQKFLGRDEDNSQPPPVVSRAQRG